MGRSYQARKDAELDRLNEQSRKGRDIGEIPDVANPERRASCERNLRLFAETYYPSTFPLEWSDDHLKVLALTEMVVLGGGLYAVAMPRGSGKTSIAEVAAQWAILYGHRAFVVLIGSDEKKADSMLDSIKMEFETNDDLLADFPESIYPITQLEGIAHRCKGQLHKGERTYIEWNAKEIVLPTIPGSKASGAIIKVAGITGAIRGMKYKKVDGSTVRPDFVIPDDPQTDESAKSASQCQTREEVLSKAVLGLAGPGKKIAAMMPCTVICPGDLADRMLDRKLHPEWHGTRTKMLNSLPENEKLWERYKEIRDESLRAEKGGVEATEFYLEHREEMDRGASAAWEHRFDPDEVSAIQHAMNIKLYRPHAFAAEYQNEPLPLEDRRSDDLTPDQIAAKITRIPRRLVPLACNRLTAFIDVQGSMLFWMACGWTDDFSGQVLDYGTFPDQKRAYFTKNDAKIGFSDLIKGAGLEGQIRAALEALTASILGRKWLRDDGAEMSVERCLIDSGWPASTAVVKEFCRQSAFSAVLTPSKGTGIKASHKPMGEWQKHEGERRGHNWRLRAVDGSRAVRTAIYDTNYWKTFVQNRLATAMGDPGCLSLFGDKPSEHRMLSDHLTSEYRVMVSSQGRSVDEWQAKPGHDNDWLDCLVGCHVAASIQGVSLREVTPAVRQKVRKQPISLDELRRRSQANKGVARAQ